jgi:pSer/pThr/pTyr-binding forkhead associated (FHA) protein
MSPSQTRLELLIDVLEKPRQRALVLSDLTPPDLITAILREFRELEYLTGAATDYELRRAEDQTSLDDQAQLGHQLADGERLVLVEKELSVPEEAQRPSRNIYLREQVTDTVYKLHWQPAIIGRPDKSQAHNQWLAVNLAAHKTGLRVSRRHAMITEDGGQFFIESLSRNPTAIKSHGGETIELDAEKYLLKHGDVIYLERSNIALKFIVREDGAPKKNQEVGRQEKGCNKPSGGAG